MACTSGTWGDTDSKQHSCNSIIESLRMLLLNAKLSILNMLLSICRLEEKKGPAYNRTFICSVHVKITTNDYLSELGEERYRLKDAEISAALSLVRKLYDLSHQL